jgi:hypothetical protein
MAAPVWKVLSSPQHAPQSTVTPATTHPGAGRLVLGHLGDTQQQGSAHEDRGAEEWCAPADVAQRRPDQRSDGDPEPERRLVEQDRRQSGAHCRPLADWSAADQRELNDVLHRLNDVLRKIATRREDPVSEA